MIKVIKNSQYLILFCLLMIPSLTYSQGSRYTGTYKKSSSLQFSNKTNIVIEGLEFSDANKRTLTLLSCNNITIKNCKFKDVNISAAIYAENSTNILITDCNFENVHRGFIAGNCKGNISFENNDIKNILGTLRGGVAFSQAVQFIGCSGPGNSISYNSIENISGESSPEDIINIYNSNGTAVSPIIVKGNWLRGGGPSSSGGGILLGDCGGSYQIAEDNILVNPGQYGMGIAGGHDMILRNNKIYSKKQSFTNVGLSICNWTEDLGKSYNINVQNNDVNWTQKDGFYNSRWFSNDMRKIIPDWSIKSVNDLKIDESILPKDILNRARNSNKPEANAPENNTPSTNITQVYIDSFKRIAIKYYSSPIPLAFGELYTSNGQLIESMTLPRFNTAFPHKLPRGEYYVKVIYSELGKTEINKITIN